MATQFNPDPKLYNQKLNGQGNDSLNNVIQNGSMSYTNSQPHLEPISPQSVGNAIEFQQMSVPATSKTAKELGSPRWNKLRLTQKATALAIALSTLPVLVTGFTAYQVANQKSTLR